MITENCLEDPAGCLGDVVGDVAGNVASGAWDSVCRSFAEAAVWVLKAFSTLFVSFPSPDLNSIAKPDGPYAISMWIATVLAVILVLGQVIRTAITHDGSAIAHGLVGLGKALLAIILVRFVTSAALTASDEIAESILSQSLGDEAKLKEWLTGLFQLTAATTPAGVQTPMSLVLILALVAIALTLVLWFELLLRNAAILVLIATAPIAAVGSVSESTRSWWTKLCGAVAQLVVLKPVIALVFAVGYGITKGAGGSTQTGGDLATILSGMLVLLLAVVAWPVIAKFFTFASVSFAGGGLAGVLGFAAGRANTRGSGTAGVNPGQLAQATEARTMASTGAKASGAAESAPLMGGSSAATGAAASGEIAGAGAGAGAAAGVGALGAVAAPLAVAAIGVDLGQRAVNSLASRMEQMASHADLDGANPHTQPAGYPQYGGSWTGSDSASAPVQQSESDHTSVASADRPAAQAGVMPETRTSEAVPVDLPAPAPQQPTPTTAHASPIEEVGR